MQGLTFNRNIKCIHFFAIVMSHSNNRWLFLTLIIPLLSFLQLIFKYFLPLNTFNWGISKEALKLIKLIFLWFEHQKVISFINQWKSANMSECPEQDRHPLNQRWATLIATQATLERNLVYAGQYKYHKDLFNMTFERKLAFSSPFSKKKHFKSHFLIFYQY